MNETDTNAVVDENVRDGVQMRCRQVLDVWQALLERPMKAKTAIRLEL